MKLLFKGFIIGIGKVIPGLSGALLAINLGVYEKMISSVTNFFDDKKENIKTLLLLGGGIVSSIVLFSSIILYLLSSYYNYIMVFFLGLIISSTIKYASGINYSWKKIILVFIVCLILLFIPSTDNAYTLSSTFNDYIMFFISGFIEIFASIVPGISGTALLMNLGMYNHTLKLISMVYNFNYIFNNFFYYFSYGLGMSVSFIITLSLINYLFKNRRELMEIIILSLSIGSIILLFSYINISFSILLIILFIIGLFLGFKC